LTLNRDLLQDALTINNVNRVIHYFLKRDAFELRGESLLVNHTFIQQEFDLVMQ
jgi:hypothetical protein